MQKLWWIFTALALLALAACGPSTAQPQEQPVGGRLPVVATHSILGDLVANVGGDMVQVTTLVGPGGDAHTFEPTPEDSKALINVRVIFENGLAFEPWLDELYSSSGSSAARVVASEGITPLEAAEHGQAAGDDQHAEGEADPHTWHDVANVILSVERIQAGLAAADPANAAAYQANAERYTAALKELDGEIVAKVAQLPPERRKLVTSHDTFGYFAHRYGFTIIGTALGSSTEAADPSPAELAELVEAVRAAGVPAIFAENVSNPRLMEMVADEAGVELGPPLYTDALDQPGSSAGTYIDMMRYNVATIVAALR